MPAFNLSALPVSPLQIDTTGPQYYTPKPWKCPMFHVKVGGGIFPWSVYKLNMTALATNSSYL